MNASNDDTRQAPMAMANEFESLRERRPAPADADNYRNLT